MKKESLKCLIKSTLSTLFVLIFFLFPESADASSIFYKNKLNYLSKQPLESYKSEIPLVVEFMTSPKKNLSVTTTNNYSWTPTEQEFHTDFIDGSIWLDIKFKIPAEAQNEEFVLDFGSMQIDMAELYYYAGSKWIFAGRTGHSISIDAMTEPTWRLHIPLLTHLYKGQNGNYHCRVKILASRKVPITVHLTPKRTYDRKSLWINTFNLTIFILYLLLIANFLIFGIMYKNKIFIDLSVTIFLVLLHQLLLKGIGPVFLWNFMIQHTDNTRISYLLGEGAVIFAGITTYRTVTFSRKESKVTIRSMIAMLILVATTFFMTVTVTNDSFIFSYYLVSLFITTIGLLIIMIQHSLSVGDKFYTNQITFASIYSSALFLVIGRGIYNIITSITHHHSSFLRFLDNDCYISIDIIVILCVIPFVLSCNKIRKKREKSMYSEIKLLKNSNKKMKRTLNMNSEIHHKLYGISTMLYNAFYLPPSPIASENNERKSLMEKNVIKIMDYLNAVCILNKSVEPKKDYMLLKNQFDNCMNFLKSFPDMRKITLNISNKIDESIIVCTDEKMLTLTTILFINTSMNADTNEKNFKVSADYKNEKLRITLQSSSLKINKKDFFYAESGISSHNYITFLKQLTEYYNGDLDCELHSTGTRFHLSLTLPPQSQKKVDYITQRKYNITSNQNNEISDHKKVMDDLLKINGRYPRILVVADDIESQNITRDILESKSRLTFHSSVQDAWNYMNEDLSNIPDIIICNYDIQGISASEFMRKCSESPIFNHIPIIFVLSIVDRNKALDLMIKGVTTTIEKPYNPDQLLSKIYSIITLINKTHKAVLDQLNNAVKTVSLQQIDSNNDTPFVEKMEWDKTNSSPAEKPQSRESAQSMVATSRTQQDILEKAGLSSREQQIAMLIASGMSDKQIGQELNISPATVATHNKKVFKKLEVHSRIELMNKLR